tara:strand:+ start:19391 stop:19522 length:132 start_codon:yes stop_codon:yes gene_type:complete
MRISLRIFSKRLKLGIGIGSLRFQTPFYSFLKIVVSPNGKSKY